MAKKSATKKAAPKRKASPKVAKRKAAPKKAKSAAPGTMEVVKPPMVDVTPEVKKDVVEVKPEPAKAEEPKVAPVEKHEDFQKALTEEPKKKGFWARLFGRS